MDGNATTRKIVSLLRRAWAAEDAGDHDAAEQAWRLAIALEDGRDAELVGDPGLPPIRLRPYLCLATCLRERGDAKDALVVLQPALARWPDDADLFAQIAMCRGALGEWERASDAFRRSLELAPRAYICILLANALDRLQRRRDALHWLRHALVIDPDYEEAHYNLGCVLARDGDLDGAIAHLRRAVEIDPAYTLARDRLASLTRSSARGDHHARRDLLRYVDYRDVDLVLARVSAPDRVRVRDVFLRRSSDAKILGSVSRRGRRDITLSTMLPIRVSLRAYLGRGRSADEFGAPETGQWPPWAVRRYLLYNTLLHEVGHLQIIDATATRAERKFAGETRAQEFAAERRRTLYSQPFEHPDPVHNAPTSDELATLELWNRLDKPRRARLARLVVAARARHVDLTAFGPLTAAQQDFLLRAITAKRGTVG